MAIDLGIDMGTAGSRIYSRKENAVIAKEPTVVALNSAGEAVAVGEKALEMSKNPGEDVTIVEPVKYGVITNFDAAVELLRCLLSAGLNSPFSKIRAAVCVPGGIGDVERHAVEEVAISAGVKDVYLIESPLAGAIGSGIDISEPKGYVVADIGAGTTEAASVSLGGIVVSKSVKVAGDAINNDIIQMIKKRYNTEIAQSAAEEIKLRLANALPAASSEIVTVKGTDMYSGASKTVAISSNELNGAIRESITGIAETIRAVLEETPPELSADLIETGVIMTGGGSALRGLGKLIQTTTGIRVYMSEDPICSAAKGAAMALGDKNLLRSGLLAGKGRKTY